MCLGSLKIRKNYKNTNDFQLNLPHPVALNLRDEEEEKMKMKAKTQTHKLTTIFPIF